MKISCPALLPGNLIPPVYAYRGVVGGRNISLPVIWADVVEGTKGFSFSIVDRHPIARNWIHWFVVNIPTSATGIAEGASGSHDNMPSGSLELLNSYGSYGYGGPKPPRGTGPHEYVMTVYALDVSTLPLTASTVTAEAEKLIKAHSLGSAATIGVFEQ
jgi:Raf kinase inhibitor-like YbhB/YbcL family protein